MPVGAPSGKRPGCCHLVLSARKVPPPPLKAACLVLQALRQPGVHFADAVLQERQVPVPVEQPGFDPGNVRGKPLAVAEGDELVLPPVQEQDRDGDVGQLKPPRADVGAALVPPSLAARRQP